MVELSEHGIVVNVEESGCLQAKVYLKTEVRAHQVFASIPTRAWLLSSCGD